MSMIVQARRTIDAEERRRAACLPQMQDFAKRIGLSPDSAPELQDLMDDFFQQALADDLEQDARMRGWHL